MLIYVGDDHGILPGSRGQSFRSMLHILENLNKKIDDESILGCNGEILNGKGYETLNVLEVAIACTLIFKKSGQRILPSQPKTFTITR